MHLFFGGVLTSMLGTITPLSALIARGIPIALRFQGSKCSSLLDYKHASVAQKLFDNGYRLLEEIIVAKGRVASGYGRGSKKLGFPTANLPYFDSPLSSNHIMAGVYFGWAAVDGKTPEDSSVIYPCVANIGKSPTFVGQENPVKIIEVHLIDRQRELPDFYGESMRLVLAGFIRSEQKFDSLPALVQQIKDDVQLAGELCSQVYREQTVTVQSEQGDVPESGRLEQTQQAPQDISDVFDLFVKPFLTSSCLHGARSSLYDDDSGQAPLNNCQQDGAGSISDVLATSSTGAQITYLSFESFQPDTHEGPAAATGIGASCTVGASNSVVVVNHPTSTYFALCSRKNITDKSM